MSLDGFTAKDSWVILAPKEGRLKEKIESNGIPLKDWDLSINYGIKTGCNDAFIITDKQRAELIEKCPKAEEIIRPILRGKDIKRYEVLESTQWVLFIPWHFPLHDDNTIVGASLEAEEAFKTRYPAVYQHLLKYKRELSERNQAETGIRYEWYALQRFGSSYWREFDLPKIMWGNLTLKPQFAYTDKPFAINAPSPFIATSDLYLLAVLNSKVTDYYIRQLGVSRSGGYVEYKPMFIEKMPVPRADNITRDRICSLIEDLHNNMKLGKATEQLENEIDKIIFEVYGLNEEEISLLLALP